MLTFKLISSKFIVEKCIVMDPEKSYSSLTWNNSGNKADETKVTKLLVVVNCNRK